MTNSDFEKNQTQSLFAIIGLCKDQLEMFVSTFLEPLWSPSLVLPIESCSSCRRKLKKNKSRIKGCDRCSRLSLEIVKDGAIWVTESIGIDIVESLKRKDCLMTIDKMCLNCNLKFANNPDNIKENEVIQLFNCGRCKVISYCSKRCQKENHALHKNLCKAWIETESDPKEATSEFFHLIYGLNPPPRTSADLYEAIKYEQFQE